MKTNYERLSCTQPYCISKRGLNNNAENKKVYDTGIKIYYLVTFHSFSFKSVSNFPQLVSLTLMQL